MKPVDRRLLTYASAARHYVIGLAIFGFVLAGLVIVQSIAISAAISPVIDGTKTFRDIGIPTLIFTAAFALRTILTYIQQAYGHRAAVRVIADLRGQVLDHAAALGSRWLTQGHTASTVTLVTSGLDDLEPYFVNFLPQLLLCCTVVPMAILVIGILDWISALVIVLCIPLIPIFMILIGLMTKKYSDARLQAMQDLGDQLLDLLAGLTTLKALGRERGPKQRVNDLGIDFAHKTMQTLYVAFLSGAALEFLATLSTALIAVEIGLRMVTGSVGLFAGLAIIMLTPEVFKPLREVGSQFHASSNGLAASQRVFDILETPLPVRTGNSEAPNLAHAVISLNELSVHAPGRNLLAPSHVTATIEPGTVTALRGKSGSGKSTTVSVLLKLINASSGSVTIDGQDVATIESDSLWNQISWVPQQPAIVPGTVLENMGLHSIEEANADGLRHAADLSDFTSVVDSLPDGWNTVVGQGGTGLSLGQRQRLALCRALIQARPLVILDEPSAHLDAMSEEYVTRCVTQLRRQGHTVLVIAHRHALLAVADKVIDIQSSSLPAHQAHPTMSTTHAEVAQ
ncbi:MAG: thiol reductant ABC exporter subunit CydD [Actinomycetaceae bacterium]|nr:thiol reductant ABC exporter subunit CydD [Actinomycetaceae bacterium]MDY6083307.1 thiol reductant ABC exporter subunit CydD [Actinomycetaceae bacterium]